MFRSLPQLAAGVRSEAAAPRRRCSITSVSARCWISFLVLAGALTAVYFAFPGHHLQLWTPLGLSAVVATVVGIRRNRPSQPAAWYLLAAAELCFITGDTLYNVFTDVLHQDNPFPSLADVFYLLTYPLFAAGLFVLIRARSTTRDRASLLDALTITTGLGLLSWVYLIVPYFHADGLTVVQRVVSVSYPLGDVLVLSMLARLVVGGGLRIVATRFLALGAFGLLAADVLYGLIQLNGTWKVGGPVDCGWAIFYTAWGTAALHPSMRQVNKRVPRGSSRISRPRLALLAVVSLIAPGVLLSESLTRNVYDVGTIGAFSAVLFLLVIARLAGIVAVHQQSVERERVLRSCGEALVAAQGLSDVYRAALAGVMSLPGVSAATEATVYLAEPDGIVRAAGSSARSDTETDLALWETAQTGAYLDPAGMVSVTPLRSDVEVRGMLVVRRPEPMIWEEHGALAALASQVALAIESASLASDLRQRQSESHFRGLIQNAFDIIIVIDEHGLIKYGTPSLERALGGPMPDVIGTPLSDLLHEDDVSDAESVLAGLAVRTAHAQSLADWRLRNDDGSYVSFEVLSSNLLDDPSVAGIVLTMRDVSERRELEQQLTHQAFHDALTGLANRALFRDRAEQALARAERLGTVVAIVMLDIDDFKVINDTRGHGAGDELLIAVARRLCNNLRAGATVARLGGDEFAILVEDIADVSAAEAIASRTLHPFTAPFIVRDEEVHARASAGLAVSGDTEATLNLSELLRCADLALYAAKDRGKGQLVRYDDDLHARMLDRLALRSELQRALAAEEFFLHYQPIVTIETGEIAGAEALVRWQHPTRGLVPPTEFVELAEDTGLIVPLGRWVLDRACAQARLWADQGHGGLRLSVNVSGRQLQEAGFVNEVRSALLRHGLAPGVLVLELTESVLVYDGSGIIPERLTALRDLGVKIAIDDFGTGYSSLAYLKHFPIDILKVDKSFVDDMGKANSEEGILAHAIVSLTHSLRLDVVAEGIERAEQRDDLWSVGCELGQGYLYSKPVGPEELSLMLAAEGHLGPPTVIATQGKVARLRVPTLRTNSRAQADLTRPGKDQRARHSTRTPDQAKELA
jgi:diguanylate cyclase (GGDEF)-like protein/PAS domain S-box-containing protein